MHTKSLSMSESSSVCEVAQGPDPGAGSACMCGFGSHVGREHVRGPETPGSIRGGGGARGAARRQTSINPGNLGATAREGRGLLPGRVGPSPREGRGLLPGRVGPSPREGLGLLPGRVGGCCPGGSGLLPGRVGGCCPGGSGAAAREGRGCCPGSWGCWLGASGALPGRVGAAAPRQEAATPPQFASLCPRPTSCHEQGNMAVQGLMQGTEVFTDAGWQKRNRDRTFKLFAPHSPSDLCHRQTSSLARCLSQPPAGWVGGESDQPEEAGLDTGHSSPTTSRRTKTRDSGRA